MPDNFDKMIKYAKKLSKPFAFVRVDFYEVAERVILGEMTFMPGAGIINYSPESASVDVGKMLKITI